MFMSTECGHDRESSNAESRSIMMNREKERNNSLDGGTFHFFKISLKALPNVQILVFLHQSKPTELKQHPRRAFKSEPFREKEQEMNGKTSIYFKMSKKLADFPTQLGSGPPLSSSSAQAQRLMTTSPGGSFLEGQTFGNPSIERTEIERLEERLQAREAELEAHLAESLLQTSTLNAAQTYDPFAEPLYNGERSSEQLFDDDNEELPFPFPIVEPSSDVNVERGEDVPEDVSTDYHGGSGDDLGDVDLLHPLVNEDDLDLVYPYPEVLPDGTLPQSKEVEEQEGNMIDDYASLKGKVQAQLFTDHGKQRGSRKRSREEEVEEEGGGNNVAGDDPPPAAHRGVCGRGGVSVAASKRRKVAGENRSSSQDHEFVEISTPASPSNEVLAQANSLLIEIATGKGTTAESDDCDAWIQTLRENLGGMEWEEEESLGEDTLFNLARRCSRGDSSDLGVTFTKMLNELMIAAKKSTGSASPNMLAAAALSNQIRQPKTPAFQTLIKTELIPLVIKLSRTIPLKIPAMMAGEVLRHFNIPPFLEAGDVANLDRYFNLFDSEQPIFRTAFTLDRSSETWQELITYTENNVSPGPFYSLSLINNSVLRGSRDLDDQL
ncbi:hypothetical protein C8R42DRAFT_649316 [Lentinula raphanica]|nr:hypothetical protein C8R42DRAFT_649316 [Lentinula raphanica]